MEERIIPFVNELPANKDLEEIVGMFFRLLDRQRPVFEAAEMLLEIGRLAPGAKSDILNRILMLKMNTDLGQHSSRRFIERLMGYCLE